MSRHLSVIVAAVLGGASAGCANIALNSSALSSGSAFAGRVMENGAKAVHDASKCNAFKVEPAVKEEYALGGAVAVHWVQRGGGLRLKGSGEPEVNVYLNTVGKNLAAQSERPTLEWTFGVLADSKNFTALSSPGGYVFVTHRLLAGVQNEAELAGVLSHEIAHIVLKHAIHQYTSSKVSLCKALAVGNAVGGALLPPAVVSTVVSGGDHGTLDLDGNTSLLGKLAEKTIDLLDKGNSKDEELEADRMAAQLMMSAGYDPRAFVSLLKRTDEGGGVFANHPKRDDRVENIEDYLKQVRATEGKQEFAGLTTQGLKSPPLPHEVTAQQGGVARDTK
ncbi:peptidase M48 [Corallococcus sp. H22C18031201]|uniref:M48 family metalloprotease n=1 Tax=Citreicoccus inhibens TaxID=2849499 RepID=UPI000E722641|nr:M48 family metalloprotease [Citreicoccus inhibens]MBU8899399.1 M48 family metalloprotease [Citreicoccus inhibens]RJS23929.1 peptidase M48 [Corallococcus sp. H22C18031201]